jgi:hypothetical protein
MGNLMIEPVSMPYQIGFSDDDHMHLDKPMFPDNLQFHGYRTQISPPLKQSLHRWHSTA